MSQLINSQNSGQIPQGNVKVMHPADVKGLTIKNLIPGGKAVASGKLFLCKELPTSTIFPVLTTFLNTHYAGKI